MISLSIFVDIENNAFDSNGSRLTKRLLLVDTKFADSTYVVTIDRISAAVYNDLWLLHSSQLRCKLPMTLDSFLHTWDLQT